MASQSSANAATQKNSANEIFRLGDLPSELQLKIFKHAVVEDKPILITPCSGRRDPCLLPPALARVNRSIRHDVLAMHYKDNAFETGLGHDPDEFASQLRFVPQEFIGGLNLFAGVHTLRSIGSNSAWYVAYCLHDYLGSRGIKVSFQVVMGQRLPVRFHVTELLDWWKG